MLERVLVLSLFFLLGGCANLSYYAQAVSGHWQVMGAARPIPDVLADPATPPVTREQLKDLPAIRDFASRALSLPDNGSYRSFADLGRPYVVWNVFAAREFSVDLEKSCLLFVGCVTYRGFYAKERAEAYAESLRRQGLETYVAGIPAYSTLGYFDDPVLNTFLRYGPLETARTVFHELAHQAVYIRDDTVFNESFATAVEEEGLRRWLIRSGHPELLADYERSQALKRRFQAWIGKARSRLAELYAAPLAEEEMRARKSALLVELRDDWEKEDEGKAYSAFFAGDMNNAQLGSIGLYTSLLPAFMHLLAEYADDLPAFYRRVKDIGRLTCAERRNALGASSEDCLPPPVKPDGSHPVN